MFWLIKTTLPLLISLLIIALINKNFSKIKNSDKFIYLFCFTWIIFFIIQYLLLGPYSPINYYDEGDIGLSRILHDKYFHLGGAFSHSIQGGADFYAVQAFGGQYLSFERLLFYIFPVWLAVLFHKLALVSFSFLGTYMLLNKGFGAKKIDSLFIGSFVSVINPYAITNTLQHGMGFAVIPLAIYVYLYLTDKKYYFIITGIFSLLIASSTSPLHSFLAVYGGIIISYFILRPKNVKYFAISSLILLLAVIINWSEVFYGFYEYGKITSRLYSDGNYWEILGSLPHLYGKSNFCLGTCNFQYSPFIIILTVLLISLIRKFNKNYLKILIFLIFCNYLPTLGWGIIEALNIRELKTLNLYNFSFYLYIPISILAIKVIENNKENIFSKTSMIFLFFSISILIMDKIDYAKKTFFEPQKAVYAIPNLIDKPWAPKNKLFRSVSTAPYIGFHPNFLWSHGYDTLDGYTNLIPQKIMNFWRYGIYRDKYDPSNKPIYGGNLFITNTKEHDDFSFAKQVRFSSDQVFDLNNLIDLNMLRLSNTAYIMSYFDLKQDGLTKVSGPDKNPFPISHNFNLKRDINYYKNSIIEKKNHLFQPKEIFIYELSDYYERIYFPKRVILSDKEMDVSEQYSFISKNYEKHAVYLSSTKEDRNSSSISYKQIAKTELGEGSILSIEKIKNGYLASIDVTKGGLLVLNQAYYDGFWKGYIDNKESKIFKINNIQTGIMVPNGKHTIKFLYERPLLREKIFNLK